MPISVGSVEVDIIPSTSGIYQRLRDALVPDATRAGEDAGTAAGRAFAPAMSSAVNGSVATAVGERIGQQISQRIAAQVRDSIGQGLRVGGQTSRPAATRAGDDAGGAFSRVFRARVEAAFRSLPRANVGMDATGFNAEMDRLRARLEALSNRRIGIDVSATDALAEIARIEERLRALGAEHPDVNVRVDTGRALAELTALRADIDRLDGRDVNVHANADTAAAVQGFSAMTTAALAFGPAILPVLPIVAAGLGLVAAAGVAAAAGIGGIAAVALPAFGQIRTALQAQKQAQDASTTSTRSGTSSALQMAGAQQALATAQRNAAQQIASARDQVVTAERGVATAERDLTQAQQAQKQAQLDLVAARKTAAQQLEDLKNQVIDAGLAQRQAAQNLADAQKQLAADQAAGAGADQIARDTLARDQAAQALAEQQVATKRLQDQQTAAAKAGVEGSATVKQAEDALAQAHQNVTDKAQALKDAQAGVAKAQQQVATAEANAADAIASAQRQIAQAQQQAAGSASAAQTAQAKYRASLAAMTPATRATFNAFLRLRDGFHAWSTALQPAVMPIFTRALDGVRQMLPRLTPLVLAAASAVKVLEDRFSRQLKAPWAQALGKDLTKATGPAILGFGTALGNIFKGAAGIVDAFLPHVASAGKAVGGWTAQFAKWGTSLKGSPAFQNFLDYVKEQAPILGKTIGNVFTAVFRLVAALAPMGGTTIALIGAITSVIQVIPVPVLKTLGVLFVSLALGMKLAALYQGILNTTMEANPIGLIITALGALVVIVIYAYQNFGWFRTAVQDTWRAVKDATLAVVDWFAGPFLDFFTKTIPAVFAVPLHWVEKNWPLLLGLLTGPVGLAVWAITHYWGQITTAFSTGWDWLKKNVFSPIGTFFTATIPGWASTLGSKVSGAFDDMQSAIGTAWLKIEKAAKTPINFVIGTVWNNGIVSVWQKIGGWIPGLPKLGKLKELAAGGVVPAAPGIYNTPTAIVGEGSRLWPEYVIPTDPKYRGRALNLYQQAGTQLLAGGGIIGSIGDTLGGAAKAVGGAVSSGIHTAADFLKNPASALASLLSPILSQVGGHFTDTAWGKLAAALAKSPVEGLKKLVTSFGGKAGGGLAPQGTGPAAAQAIARNMLKAFAWGTDQFAPLVKLWNGESGWRWNALNKASGAYGIPQSLPASKMASAGPDWRTNPATQITWGLGYIRSRYYTPANAWAQWQARSPHWYDTGGQLQPGLSLVANGTGRPEMVLTDSQWATAAAALARTTGVGRAGQSGGSIADIAQAIADMRVTYRIGDEPIALVARKEVQDANGHLISVLSVGGGG